jgi:hypothetical protein
MKTIKLIITAAFFLLFSLGVLAQGPPNPPDGHGGDQDEGPGGGAPIGSGLVIMTILTAAYGGKKAYSLKRKSE